MSSLPAQPRPGSDLTDCACGHSDDLMNNNNPLIVPTDGVPRLPATLLGVRA